MPGLYYEAGDYGYSRVQEIPQAVSTKTRRQRREKGRQGWCARAVLMRSAILSPSFLEDSKCCIVRDREVTSTAKVVAILAMAGRSL